MLQKNLKAPIEGGEVSIHYKDSLMMISCSPNVSFANTGLLTKLAWTIHTGYMTAG